MPVHEILMKPGSFDIRLDPATPKKIRSTLVEFGSIVIYDAPVDPRLMADADALVAAIYVGVLRRKPTPFDLSGAGLTSWLGDEEGKASTLQSYVLAAGQTFVQLVTTVLTGFGPVVIGNLTAIAGTLGAANNTTPVSARVALDFIMAQLGGEYRVRTDNANSTNKVACDAGPSASLYNTTPKVIVTPGEGGREPSGLLGIRATMFDYSVDADSWTYGIIVNSGPNQVRFSSPYKDLRGGTYTPGIVLSQPIVAAGNAATAASSAFAQHDVRKELKITSDRYALSRDIKVGDWLYVFDPQNDVYDTANQVVFRGEMINPMALRIFEMNWPVQEGMSVFYRDATVSPPLYTDLTRYITFEGPGTTFQVGVPIRGLTVP